MRFAAGVASVCAAHLGGIVVRFLLDVVEMTIEHLALMIGGKGAVLKASAVASEDVH